jgi:hypothetical protein
MVTMAMSDAKVEGRPGSFGKKVGQMVLGFEKRDAPLHLQRRIQKPPRPWNPVGRKKVGPSFRGGYSTRSYQPYDPTRPSTAPSDRPDGGSSRSSWGGSGWGNISRGQGSSGGDNRGGRSSTGSARAVMEPAQKKARDTTKEEDTFRAVLVQATDRYRGNPSGIATMTEKAIAAMGLQPDRNEVLAVTAKILAYRKANHGKGKHKRRFQNEEMNVAVRDCLEKYSNTK